MNDTLIARNKTHIQKLKAQLKEEFDTKDLRETKKILGKKISRDKSTRKFWISQENYFLKMLKRFNMVEARSDITPLVGHFKLSSKQCLQSPEEKDEMPRVSYASVVGSLMYVMVCIRPDLPYAVSIVSRFISNSGKQHWEAVK